MKTGSIAESFFRLGILIQAVQFAQSLIWKRADHKRLYLEGHSPSSARFLAYIQKRPLPPLETCVEGWPVGPSEEPNPYPEPSPPADAAFLAGDACDAPPSLSCAILREQKVVGSKGIVTPRDHRFLLRIRPSWGDRSTGLLTWQAKATIRGWVEHLRAMRRGESPLAMRPRRVPELPPPPPRPAPPPNPESAPWDAQSIAAKVAIGLCLSAVGIGAYAFVSSLYGEPSMGLPNP